MSIEVTLAISNSSPLSFCVLYSYRSIIPTLSPFCLAEKSMYLPATLAYLYLLPYYHLRVHCADIIPYSHLIFVLYIPDIVNIYIIVILRHHFQGLYPLICTHIFARCAMPLNLLVPYFFHLSSGIVFSYQFQGIYPSKCT